MPLRQQRMPAAIPGCIQQCRVASSDFDAGTEAIAIGLPVPEQQIIPAGMQAGSK